MAIPTYSTSANSAFVERQLMDVSQAALEQDLPVLNGMEDMPPQGRVAVGAKSFNRRVKQHFGKSKWLAPDGDDTPRVSAGIIEDVYSVDYHGVIYGYTQQELLAAQFGDEPIEADRALSARVAISQFNNDIAIYGSAERRITGLLSIPYIPRLQYDIALFRPGANPQQTLAVLYAMESQILTANKQAVKPNALRLDLDSYNFIASTEYSTLNPRTILEVFLANSQFVKDVKGYWEFSNAGPNGEPVIAMLTKAPDRLEHNLPIPNEVLAPQFKAFNVDMPMFSATAGVISEKPISHVIVELID